MRCHFLLLQCLAFHTVASHNSFPVMLWYQFSPMLESFLGCSLNFSWCLSSGHFPWCSPHIYLMEHSSEWLQNFAVNHWTLLLNHLWPQVFQSECPESLDLQEKVCEAFGSGTKPRNLAESHSFSEAQGTHFVNCKALTKWQESVKDSSLHLQAGVLLGRDWQPPDSHLP